MGSNDLGEVVREVVGVVVDPQEAVRHTDAVVIEADWHYALVRGVHGKDARETLGGERWTQPSRWGIGKLDIPHVTKPELVDGGGAERFGDAYVYNLRPTVVTRGEPRETCSTVRIKVDVIVHEIVARNHTQTGVGIDPAAAFVVPERFLIG